MIKKHGWLLGLALAGSGCISPMVPFDEMAHKDKDAEVQAVQPITPPPVVTPDQVTEENAAETAQALSREMDYDAYQHSAVSSAPAKENTKKP